MSNTLFMKEVYSLIQTKGDTTKNEVIEHLKKKGCTNPEHLLSIMPKSRSESFVEVVENQPLKFVPPFNMECFNGNSFRESQN